MNRLDVPLKVLPHGDGLALPTYMTPGAAGMDLRAALDEPLHLAPGEYRPIPTGIALALPAGYEAMIRPRSGLALRHGITTLNAPGTIDSDYRGEIQVILINHGQDPFTIQRGERIAQMVINAVVQVVWQPTQTLPPSERGTGGFGHTGV